MFCLSKSMIFNRQITSQLCFEINEASPYYTPICAKALFGVLHRALLVTPCPINWTVLFQEAHTPLVAVR
jgi:hypothetical protein